MSRSVEPVLKARFKKVRKTKGKNGLEYKVCCPFCKDKRYKMYINPEKYGGVYNCYKCGKAGSLSSLLGDTFKMAPAQVARVKEEPLPSDVESPGFTVPLTELDEEHPAIVYLTQTRKNKFDPKELTEVFGVRYCSQGKVYGSQKAGFYYDTSNTLIFPVWMFGKPVGWQSRLLYDPDAMDDSQCAALGYMKDEDGDWIRPPKYWTNPGFRKGRVLFNFDIARNTDYVVVTEGVFDAMAVGQSGVATFGKGIDENQARLLKTYWDTVVILLDPGDASEQTQKLIEELHRAVTVIPIDLMGYKDAGDAPRDEIWRQIAATIEHRRLAVNEKLSRETPQAQPEPVVPAAEWKIING